jgi:hypothetical protein
LVFSIALKGYKMFTDAYLPAGRLLIPLGDESFTDGRFDEQDVKRCLKALDCPSQRQADNLANEGLHTPLPDNEAHTIQVAIAFEARKRGFPKR